MLYKFEGNIKFSTKEHVKSWQFTKENFREGIPRWIKDNKDITLWSQYGGRIIGGKYETDDYIFNIREGNYIQLSKEGNILIC